MNGIKYFVDSDGVYMGAFDEGSAPVDGVQVPDAPSDARQIWGGAAWFPPPAEDLLTLPMDRLTFWLVAASAGVSKWSIRDRIAAMPETLEKREAIAWFEEAERYRRYDPILTDMAVAEGIPPEQLDALWIWGLQTYDPMGAA